MKVNCPQFTMFERELFIFALGFPLLFRKSPCVQHVWYVPAVFAGQSTCVLKPSSTAEVSAIVRYCNEKSLAICPQGGNTCLVGGSVPVFDEVILSMAAMNKVESFDPVAGMNHEMNSATLIKFLQTVLILQASLPVRLAVYWNIWTNT